MFLICVHLRTSVVGFGLFVSIRGSEGKTFAAAIEQATRPKHPLGYI